MAYHNEFATWSRESSLTYGTDKPGLASRFAPDYMTLGRLQAGMFLSFLIYKRMLNYLLCR